MSQIRIIELRVDDEGTLHVNPDLKSCSDYKFIFRDASSVRWDSELRSLYTLPVKYWSTVDCYKQILSAIASEYGDHLVLTPETRWKGIPDNIISEIRNLDD